MDLFQSLTIVLVALLVVWISSRLKSRIEVLEHEVRWLRMELESVKPTEIKSAYDE